MRYYQHVSTMMLVCSNSVKYSDYTIIMFNIRERCMKKK